MRQRLIMVQADTSWQRVPWVGRDGAERRGGARDAFRELSLARKAAVLSLAATEGLLHAAERRFGIRRTTGLLAKVRAPRPISRALAQGADERKLAHGLTTLHMIGHELVPVGFDCVSTSVSIWWLMRLVGLDPRLHVGVRSFGGVFEAHAWVSLDGEVVNDPRGEYLDYIEMPSVVREA